MKEDQSNPALIEAILKETFTHPLLREITTTYVTTPRKWEVEYGQKYFDSSWYIRLHHHVVITFPSRSNDLYFEFFTQKIDHGPEVNERPSVVLETNAQKKMSLDEVVSSQELSPELKNFHHYLEVCVEQAKQFGDSHLARDSIRDIIDNEARLAAYSSFDSISPVALNRKFGIAPSWEEISKYFTSFKKYEEKISLLREHGILLDGPNFKEVYGSSIDNYEAWRGDIVPELNEKLFHGADVQILLNNKKDLQSYLRCLKKWKQPDKVGIFDRLQMAYHRRKMMKFVNSF